jgi:hypothetical protein
MFGATVAVYALYIVIGRALPPAAVLRTSRDVGVTPM